MVPTGVIPFVQSVHLDSDIALVFQRASCMWSMTVLVN